MKELEGKKYHCFFELTLQIIGGKWKPIILYHLSLDPVQRFSDLRRGLPAITRTHADASVAANSKRTRWFIAKYIAKCLPGSSTR